MAMNYPEKWLDEIESKVSDLRAAIKVKDGQIREAEIERKRLARKIEALEEQLSDR